MAHSITECKMAALKIMPDRPVGEINQDIPSLLEILADNLAELGEMSKGNFNNPPWDNCNKNTARACLDGMIENIKFLARINNIKIV